LDKAYQAVIDQIHAVVRGSFATLGEKLANLFQKQDERDRILSQLSLHKRETHSRRKA